MLEDVECPYCDEYNEIDHDDGYGYGEDEVFEQECCNCEKIFVYSTHVMYDYRAEKAPCKNGGEHKLVDIHRHPKEFAVGVKRCVYCDEEIEVDSEARQEAVGKYFKHLHVKLISEKERREIEQKKESDA